RHAVAARGVRPPGVRGRSLRARKPAASFLEFAFETSALGVTRRRIAGAVTAMGEGLELTGDHPERPVGGPAPLPQRLARQAALEGARPGQPLYRWPQRFERATHRRPGSD